MMKTKLPLALLVGLSSVALIGAPLTQTTAVHQTPNESSPAIGYLKAGTEPVPAADALATTPAGWMAVEMSGPFEGYVGPNGLTKSLDVRPGTPIHLGPKADTPVLTTMEKGDNAEMTGRTGGRWTQVRFQKKLVGYIRASSPALPPAATAPSTSSAPTSQPQSTAPASTTAQPSTVNAADANRPAMTPRAAEDRSSAFPRQYRGKFVSTKRPFAPRRPYDYQLNDDSGVRFAYVDVSRLLQTEQIDKYVDHVVAIHGTASYVPEVKGIVLVAESLQLK